MHTKLCPFLLNLYIYAFRELRILCVKLITEEINNLDEIIHVNETHGNALLVEFLGFICAKVRGKGQFRLTGESFPPNARKVWYAIYSLNLTR